jgi:tripartite-type tricarboxylate transporter receptor subunit TctC
MNKFTRRVFTTSAAAAAVSAGLGLKPSFAQGAYPSRPVTILVPWAAGGATDAVTRMIAALLEKDLGQPFNVVNRTGGSGVVGHTAIASSAPDGYTLGMITIEVGMMHWQGISTLNPSNFTPLALMSEDPPGVLVNAESPYKTVKDLADAIKASPAGKFKGSGAGQGSIWHLALVGWLQAMGLKADHVRWVPSNGGAPALQELAANGVDVVTCSVPEGRAMMDAGKVRPLAAMARERNPQFANVPTLKEGIGVDFSLGSWRGIAGPKGLPQPIVDRLAAALKKAQESKEFRDFMDARGFALVWADAAGFGKFMDENNATMGALLKSAGLAKT